MLGISSKKWKPKNLFKCFGFSLFFFSLCPLSVAFYHCPSFFSFPFFFLILIFGFCVRSLFCSVSCSFSVLLPFVYFIHFGGFFMRVLYYGENIHKLSSSVSVNRAFEKKNYCKKKTTTNVTVPIDLLYFVSCCFVKQMLPVILETRLSTK